MKCSCGLSSVGSVVGLLAVGMMGYNALTTGCPLGGGFCAEKEETSVLSVGSAGASSVRSEEAGCELGCSSKKALPAPQEPAFEASSTPATEPAPEVAIDPQAPVEEANVPAPAVTEAPTTTPSTR